MGVINRRKGSEDHAPRKIGTRTRHMVVASLLATVSLSTIPVSPAGAEVSNCTQFGPGGNYFDGSWKPSSSYIGVSAEITVRYAAVCDSDTSQYNQATESVGNFSAAWSMIADSGGNGWLQSGYIRAYAQGDVSFSQEYNPYTIGLYTKFQNGVSAGQVHQYWQQASGGTYYSNVDTSRLITVSAANLTYGWAGYSQQFFGEDKYLSSDMPGGVGSYGTSGTIQVQDSSDNWHNVTSGFLTTANDTYGNRWVVQSTGSQSFNIWTANYGV